MIIHRLLIAVGLLAAVLCLDARSSHAGLYGNARWCAVVDNGGGEMTWECEYDTVEDCMPAVIQGSRGFCQLNPYWKG
jgi:hypothetical protein